MLKGIIEFHKKLLNDKHDRYRSWEHCYLFFKSNRNKDVDINLFSLNLFAYLASWGMLRGSSFLLQKDYTFHNDVVEELLKSKYDILIDLNPKDINEETVSLLLKLKLRMIEIYHNNTQVVNGEVCYGKLASDTLITKILLGTLGCSPAYDRYFIDGLRDKGIPNLSFKRKSLFELKKFYIRNSEELINTQNHINTLSEVQYPMMKIVDMYFWEIGYQLDSK